MNCLPVRFFHAFLSGVVIVVALALGILSIETPVLATPPSGGVSTSPTTSPRSPSQAPAGPLVPPTPNDLDGDGIPNDWETTNSHNPNDFTDSAGDFDKDGLTALQEYQLSVSSGGAYGKPLGKWAPTSLPMPQSYLDEGFQYMWPVGANDRGDIVVQVEGEFTDVSGNSFEKSACALVKPDGSWTTIFIPGKTSGFIYAQDINENGTVLLLWCSEDGSQFETHRYSQDGTTTLVQLNGANCYATRMNNYGDWIGWSFNSSTGTWTQARVINGRNVANSNISTYWEYIDINDYGETIGTYFDPILGKNLTFLEYGPFFFSTGRPGDFSFLDGALNSSVRPAAINNWGEFAGGGSRSEFNGSNSQNRPFFFDGDYQEIKPGVSGFDSSSPLDISDFGQVLIRDPSVTGQYATSLWSDHIRVPISKLWSDPRTLYPSKFTPSGTIIFSAYDSSSGSYSIISLHSDDDTDGDGMPDDWEAYYGLNPNLNDANADFDHDGTNNLGEFLLSSNPTTAPVIDPAGNPIDLRPGIDTDGDGIPNTWEWSNGLNYNDASDAPLDFDRDGYTNLQEFRLNTDPRGAPSYRIREIGPFPAASSVSLSSATLGNGSIASLTEWVFFTGTPSVATGSRPAAWSLQRQDDSSSFSFFPAAAPNSVYTPAQSNGGASLSYSSGNPTIYQYWSSPASVPVSLSGAASVYDVAGLSYPKLSSAGVYLVATRRLASNGNIYQPIVWKMPVAGQPIVAPVKLVPPAGVTLSDFPALSVNDYGYVTANGTVGGQNRPILWRINDTGTTVTSIVLPPLTGGTWATANGLSNQASPWVIGSSSSSTGQRAVVWNTAGAVTNLGTLVGGNHSSATCVSPNGKVAGSSNILVGTSLKSQPFVAFYESASASWQLQAQGDPTNIGFTLSSMNDAGEILGTLNQTTPVHQKIPTLWRHGRAYSLSDILPTSTGYTLDTISALNASGTLLATTWKDGARTSIILTTDRDTDGDGLPDAFENQNALNPFVKSALTADTDSDGLTDLEEYRNGTNLRNPDSDGDGMKDGWEVSWGLLPLDPSDADLDPDNDRVTNLRESQIADSSPTGIYQVQVRLADTSWMFPWLTSANDGGKIVFTQEGSNGGSSDESYHDYWNTQDYFSLPRADSPQQAPVQLPSFSDYQYSDDTFFSYETSSPQYWADSISGNIHASMVESSIWGDQTGYSYGGETYLMPNIESQSSWISWSEIMTNLKQGSPPLLSVNDSLEPNPVAVSSSGTRRIHRAYNSGIGFILNESGQFVRTISLSTSWRLVSDQGQAVALVPKYIPPTNGVVGYSAPELRVSNGVAPDMTVPIPHTPGKSPNYTLRSLSNDGKVLLSRSEANSQFQSVTKYFVFDIGQQTLTPVRQPNLGSETINLLSLKNQRLVGSGPKPFQITPDGTCVRLDALRIKTSPTSPSVPFGSLYTQPLTLNHIASDGRITLTTTNAQYQTIILQISPYNDADNDGLPDDWETAYALSDPNGDADGDEMTNAEEFFLQSNPQDSRPPISNFRGIQNADGTITYSWISFAYPGEWFRIRLPQPGGSYRTVFETTYGSSRLPYISGKQLYSITLNPATDYKP